MYTKAIYNVYVYRTSNTIKVWVTKLFFNAARFEPPSHHHRWMDIIYAMHVIIYICIFVYELRILAKVHIQHYYLAVCVNMIILENFVVGVVVVAVKHISNFKVYNWVIYWPHVAIAIGGHRSLRKMQKMHDFCVTQTFRTCIHNAGSI